MREQPLSPGMILRLKRTEKRLPLIRVADAVGISENHLSHIERDSRTPGDDVIRDLARFYGIDELDLFDLYGKVPLSITEEIGDNEALRNTLYEISNNENLSTKQKSDLYARIKRLYEEFTK
ncbi:helix-turn-helix domain-containing protein [Bacillus wiedmannii]|uniref:helix-turn-helix domain-containing protein n=1 Tax=Bacillus wiedmannii TaxID=1890302 RepID=UPI000BF155DF|nr:helix-turn-helix domain-containing protein [Bacillus wiedmannii]PEM08519.1 hypothetical protein CN610_19905 [Bacillus wiedmannii]